MDVRKLVAELANIQQNPRDEYVAINVAGPKTTFVFDQQNPYYYPLGIVRIQLQRGGAGVIYIYTTQNPDPHLTIPFDGQVHWTQVGGQRSYEDQRDSWPPAVRSFYDEFQ